MRPGKKHLVWVYRWTCGFEFALSTDALIQTSPAKCGAFLFLGEAECGEPIKVAACRGAGGGAAQVAAGGGYFASIGNPAKNCSCGTRRDPEGGQGQGRAFAPSGVIVVWAGPDTEGSRVGRAGVGFRARCRGGQLRFFVRLVV